MRSGTASKHGERSSRALGFTIIGLVIAAAVALALVLPAGVVMLALVVGGIRLSGVFWP